ncbi:MAG: DUF1801 domain-containing protein [Polyangiaceae bacterium]
MAKIREIFRKTDPEIVEEWKWMGSPVWSRGGILAVANAHRDKVKVTFAQGASLADPDKVFNAGLDGNRWRAIDLQEGDEIDEAGLMGLVREAIRHNLSRGKAPRAKVAVAKPASGKSPAAKAGGSKPAGDKASRKRPAVSKRTPP